MHPEGGRHTPREEAGAAPEQQWAPRSRGLFLPPGVTSHSPCNAVCERGQEGLSTSQELNCVPHP